MSQTFTQISGQSPDRNGGGIWGLLQAERSKVCQAMVDEARPIPDEITGALEAEPSDDSPREVEWRHCECLQQRLQQIDDALDRLIAGTYGQCHECGGAIEDMRLVADPAATHCLTCQLTAEGETSFRTL